MLIYSLCRNIILVGAILATSQTQAQDSYQPGGFMYVNHIQNAALVNLTINPVVDEIENASAKKTSTPVNAPPKLTPAAIASLGFTASSQRRTTNLDKIFAAMDVKVPGVGSQLKEAFAANNIYGEVEKIMGTYAMRTDNIADAFAMYWVASWQVANGVEAEPSKASVAAVKRQAAQAMLAVDGVKSMSPAAKQEMADGLIVSLVLISAAQEGAKADPSQKAMIAQQANDDARTLGLDHSLFTLTDAGFVAAR